ncbi:MAG: hypothetical protein COA42_19440 [Alteromonadaceae bacterium]|nr:MAG: hypothetical protein COA42_19440 [Alteromonadaceae bacterium]
MLVNEQNNGRLAPVERSKYDSVLEFAPLSVFLLYSRLIGDPTISENWAGPYYSASVFSFVALCVFALRKIELNRCYLGIYFYFLIGSVGLLANQAWLNSLLGVLDAAGMLASIAFVGLVSAFFSATGFIGVQSVDKVRLRWYSVLLVGIAIAAAILAYMNKGAIILGQLVPFILLFTIHGFIKKHLSTP